MFLQETEKIVGQWQSKASCGEREVFREFHEIQTDDNMKAFKAYKLLGNNPILMSPLDLSAFLMLHFF